MCLHILSCLFPPLAVCFKKGVGCDLCINCLLTILGWIPGCCHACYIVSQDPPVVHSTVVIQQQPQSVIVPHLPPSYAYSHVAPPQHTTVHVS